VAADLAGYAMIPRRPLAFDYRRARLFTNPPLPRGLFVAFDCSRWAVRISGTGFAVTNI
jgi:hypothetical protein